MPLIIPADGLERLSDKEIVDMVRQAQYEAYWRHGEFEADRILSGGYLAPSSDSYSRLVEMLDTCAGDYPSAMEALRNLPNPGCRNPGINQRGRTVIRIAKRDGWKCHYCEVQLSFRPLTSDEKYPEIEHKIPRARGGSNHMDNLVLSCPTCNMRKGARYSYEEFVAMMRDEG